MRAAGAVVYIPEFTSAMRGNLKQVKEVRNTPTSAPVKPVRELIWVGLSEDVAVIPHKSSA